MRSFVIVTFALLTFGLSASMAWASPTITPCAPEAKAREAARMVEANLYEQVRRSDATISTGRFQRAIDEMTWDFIRGEFVSEVIGYDTTMGNMRVTVICKYNIQSRAMELHPLVSFEAGQ